MAFRVFVGTSFPVCIVNSFVGMKMEATEMST